MSHDRVHCSIALALGGEERSHSLAEAGTDFSQSSGRLVRLWPEGREALAGVVWQTLESLVDDPVAVLADALSLAVAATDLATYPAAEPVRRSRLQESLAEFLRSIDPS